MEAGADGIVALWSRAAEFGGDGMFVRSKMGRSSCSQEELFILKATTVSEDRDGLQNFSQLRATFRGNIVRKTAVAVRSSCLDLRSRMLVR